MARQAISIIFCHLLNFNIMMIPYITTKKQQQKTTTSLNICSSLFAVYIKWCLFGDNVLTNTAAIFSSHRQYRLTHRQVIFILFHY